MEKTRIRSLEWFLALAEEQNFTRAGERLSVAPPRLSQEMRRLERDLGVQLLSRRKTRVSLTSAGIAFAADLRKAFDTLEKAIDTARRTKHGPIGLLRVGFPGATAATYLPTAIRRYRELSPDVKIELTELPTHEQLDWLRAGRLDLGIVVKPLRAARDDMMLLNLWREPLIAALPLEHPLAGRDRVRLAELAADAWVLFPRTSMPTYSSYVEQLCAAAGFAPRVAQESRHWATLVSLVAAGVGVTLLPEPVTRLWPGAIAYSRIAEPEPSIEIAALRMRSNANAAVAPFLDVLVGVANGHRTPEGQGTDE